LLNWIKKLFKTMHRQNQLTASGYTRSMQRIRNGFLKAVRHPPPRGDAYTLANRFKGKRAQSYFTFLTTPGVEPTNNLTEQALRQIVIDKRITQGTRGKTGRYWYERIWSIVATCSQQGQSVYDFLLDALNAYFQHKPAPSLLPLKS